MREGGIGGSARRGLPEEDSPVVALSLSLDPGPDPDLDPGLPASKPASEQCSEQRKKKSFSFFSPSRLRRTMSSYVFVSRTFGSWRRHPPGKPIKIQNQNPPRCSDVLMSWCQMWGEKQRAQPSNQLASLGTVTQQGSALTSQPCGSANTPPPFPPAPTSTSEQVGLVCICRWMDGPTTALRPHPLQPRSHQQSWIPISTTTGLQNGEAVMCLSGEGRGVRCVKREKNGLTRGWKDRGV